MRVGGLVGSALVRHSKVMGSNPIRHFNKKNSLSKQLFSDILTSVLTLKTSNLFNVDVSHLMTYPKMSRTITITLYGSPATWQNRTLCKMTSTHQEKEIRVTK